MKTKTLYVIVSDGGDGSYYPKYTFNAALIEKLERAYNEDKMDYENGMGCDGDGFHYDELQVPEEWTAAALGKSMINDNYADRFFSEEDE